MEDYRRDRSRDVWWFWMVHFALDMTQFFQDPQQPNRRFLLGGDPQRDRT